MNDSIFTKIIKGEAPSHKIYEDDKTFAFMDIHPIQPGHVVVVSKTETDHVFDLNKEDYEALFATAKTLGPILKKIFNTSRTTMLVIGFDVAHAHINLVPIDNSETLHLSFANMKSLQEAQPDHDDLENQANLIRSAINA